jgi:hypothetical protein
MNSLLSEQKLNLSQAATRTGVNPSTVWRWILKGVRNVKLESYAVGVKRFTTVEALERFTERCTAAATGVASETSSRTNAQRDRDIERAKAELARAGI